MIERLTRHRVIGSFFGVMHAQSILAFFFCVMLYRVSFCLRHFWL